MKNLFLIAIVTVMFLSCNSGPGKKPGTDEQKVPDTENNIVAVDTLLAHSDNYIEKTVSIKGFVVHTCKHSGKKMFLAGTDKNKFVKVIAGPGISRFDQSLEGETVVATGKVTLLDETEEKHQESAENRMKNMGTTANDTATTGDHVTETKTKKLQMTCTTFKVVE